MNDKPTIEVTRLDLINIRAKLESMRRVRDNADWLSHRSGVDVPWYKGVVFKSGYDVIKGEKLEKQILKLYPELV